MIVYMMARVYLWSLVYTVSQMIEWAVVDKSEVAGYYVIFRISLDMAKYAGSLRERQPTPE